MATDPNRYPQSNLDAFAFRPWHVGLDMGGKNQNAITPENIFLCAGPARLSDIGGDFSTAVFPLGVIEQISISQQKSVQPVRELGSRRSYIIGGYSTGQIQLSKVMFAQSSLMVLMTSASGDGDGIDNELAAFPPAAFNNQQDVARIFAQRNFGINMQSERLDRPVGLLVYMLDQRNLPYGSFYIEEVMIQSHSFQAAAQAVAISEQVSAMFDRAIPVQVVSADA